MINLSVSTRVVLVLALIGVLQGCPKPSVINLYNNSAHDLVIRAEGIDITWPSGTNTSLRINAHRLRHTHDNEAGGSIPVIDVISATGESSYAIFPPPSDFVLDGANVEIFLQLENDGALYAVHAGQALPASELLPQPKRFPLHPM